MYNDQQKEQKDKSSTKTTQEIKDWATRTQQKHPGELKCSGRVGCSCSITGNRLVTAKRLLIF
jgi:hypothetical protein